MMKEDYIIKITGSQKLDDELEEIDLTTKGNFAKRGGCYYITYKESEATGFAGCTTTLKVDGQRKVTLLRYGATENQMVVEPGQRNLFHYNTAYGSMLLGVWAHTIETKLDENGGQLTFSYSLDLNAETLSHNEVVVQVRRS